MLLIIPVIPKIITAIIKHCNIINNAMPGLNFGFLKRLSKMDIGADKNIKTGTADIPGIYRS